MPRSARTFQRQPDLSARLTRLALDVQWAWNPKSEGVWRRLDDDLWRRSRNPWLVLQHVSADRLRQLAADGEFMSALKDFETARSEYRATPGWRPTHTAAPAPVAYFSMEFGLDEALPLYAGGLGVLAGDLLKSASDLDVPVVGVGLLWQQGYFRQLLDANGTQTALFPFNDPASLPIEPVMTPAGDRLRVSLGFAGRRVLLRVWRVTVGRAVLYLLDSNDPFNAASDRSLTSVLYGGTAELRLLQEIILGVGGWRLIEALELPIEVCHLNEGHAAFVIVERARAVMARTGASFHDALWATRAGNVFTTHTAVAAGFDMFSPSEFQRFGPYLDEYLKDLGISFDEFLALGRQTPSRAEEPFNMAYLAFRGCAWVNAVSTLHGEVSRQLFSGLFPRYPVAEVPVASITNGVHLPSWASQQTQRLLTEAAGGAEWYRDSGAFSRALGRISDEQLWQRRTDRRHALVQVARERLQHKLARQVGPTAARRLASHVLRTDVLTLGFARRFAAYKRPTLLLTDPERLLAMLGDSARPVQIVVAGKAHPHDEHGRALLQQWVQFAARPDARSHVVFIEDYDLGLAADLVQGVDLWLNTPRRPWEACGTSGMKILANGGLNLSSLDGWWAEAYEPECGWAIADDPSQPENDEWDAASLYTLLEEVVIPTFYDRDATGYPRQWIGRIRASTERLGPRFSSARMLQDYCQAVYEPARALYQQRADISRGVASALAEWSRTVEEGWPTLRLGPSTRERDGTQLVVSVVVDLGTLSSDVLQVQLYADGLEATPPTVQPMALTGWVPTQSNAAVYTCRVETDRPATDFTPRAVPYHPDARLPIELPLIAWATP